MNHVRTINQMIKNAEQRGRHILADYAIHSMPISARIVQTRQVRGIIQGYIYPTCKWVAIKPETLREL